MRLLRFFSSYLLNSGLLLAAAAPAMAGEPVSVCWLKEPVADHYALPSAQSIAADCAGELHLVAAPGQYEPASFHLLAAEGLSGVLPQPTELLPEWIIEPLPDSAATSSTESSTASIAAQQVDIRVVKHWYQAARSARKTTVPVFVPELLLKDDALVKVEDGNNFVRFADGTYKNISERASYKHRGNDSVSTFTVKDADALQPLDIAAGGQRQFWVTVHVPEDAAPGLYKGEITIEHKGGVLPPVPYTLEVLPFELAESDLTHSMFYRAKLNERIPQGTVGSETRSQTQYLVELENIVAHGITSPNLYQRHNSPLLDTALKLRQQAGVSREELYFVGMPAVPGKDTPVPRNFASNVKAAIRKANQFGIGQVYTFGRDEAKADSLQEQKEVWQLARANGAKMFVSGYHTTQPTGPGNFDLMGEYHDLFMAINPVTREEAARWHSIGKQIFSYQNPTGGMERPDTFRRNYGLFLWQMDYDGAMHYAYQDSFANAWNDFDHYIYRDHNFVYPTTNGVIDTLQWEGVREGVDDTRYLATLQDALSVSSDAALKAEVEQWLAALKQRSLGVLEPGYQRRRMTGYILALQGSQAAQAADGLEISNVQFVPGRADRPAEIRWRTNYRAAAELLVGDRKVVSGALMYEHRLPLPELKNGETLSYQLAAVAGDTRVTSDQLSLTVQRDPVVTVSNSSVVAEIAVDSSWQAHSFVADDSLLAWWRFDGTGDEEPDAAGSGSKGEFGGDAVRADGFIGGGVSFDGGGDYVLDGDVETAEGSPVTIEGWFRFNELALQRGARQGLFTGLYQHQVNNHLYFHGKKSYFEVSSLIQTGVWHHIVLVYGADTSDAVIYIDGYKVPVSAAEKEPLEALDGFAVGRSSGFFGGILSGGTTQFNGDVDEVRVWNRRLSDAEVAASFGRDVHKFNVTAPAGPAQVISVNAAGGEARAGIR